MIIKSINSTGRSKFLLKTTPELMANNLVSICVPDPFIQFYYPLDKASEQVRERLLAGAILTPDFEIIRKSLHGLAYDSLYFIHSLLTHWYIDDEVTDLSEKGFTALGTTKNIPLMTYVSAPGYENIFFVIGYTKMEDKLICVEVDKRKPITYRTVTLLTSQVKITKRISSGVRSLSLEELVYLDKAALNKRMMEIEMAEKEFKDKYAEEDK